MSGELFRYVALGDSTGVGVGAANDGGLPERLYRRMKSDGFPAGILNLCQSGATTKDLLQGVVQNAVSKRPSLVTLGVGTNDLWRMVPVGTFAMNLKLIAQALEGTGAAVVVSNLPDLALAPVAKMAEVMLGVPLPIFAKRVDELNAEVNALARRKNFVIVDMLSFSRRELPGHPEYMSSDGFHPSAAGYDRWAELMYPPVAEAAKRWLEAKG